jgi:mannitol-1-phosphate 5-dehydrogenase
MSITSKSREILIWGAGKIGRGFIGDLFHRGGYRLLFIDSSRELVNALNKRGYYTVLYVPAEGEQRSFRIERFEAIHTAQAELLSERIVAAELMAVCVYPNAFDETAASIAAAVERRAAGDCPPLDVLLCTNILHPTPLFRQALVNHLSKKGRKYLEKKVGLIETLILRIAIEPSGELKSEDPLLVCTNGYPQLPVDATSWKGSFPEIEGLRPSNTILAEEIRKIYTYNMVHALAAYLGQPRGYAYIAECLQDGEIRAAARTALEEVGAALQKEYSFSETEMFAWCEGVIDYLGNPILKDTVQRVGGDPIRKLSREDRLTGPALLCRKHGIEPDQIARAIAHAFRFRNSGDPAAVEIARYLEKEEIGAAIRRFCQLDRESELIRLIEKHYQAISR